jgi:hypothetical protein
MKPLMLLLLCLCCPLSNAKLLTSNNVVLPDSSPMTFLGVNEENQAYLFKGQAKLSGLLTAGWIKNFGDDSDKISHRLELRFYPQITQVSQLPSLKNDPYQDASERMIVLSHSQTETRKLVLQHFSHIPDNFFKYQEGVLKQPASVIIDRYQTYVECDSRSYTAKLVSAEKIASNKAPLALGSGCNSEYSLDMYITQSKDNYVNLRAQANAKSDILRQMPNNESLEKISTSGNWLYVRLYQEPTITGYVHKSQIIALD